MIIAPRVVEGIRRDLESAYPDEGCGFLLGSSSRIGTPDGHPRIDAFVPVDNRRRADGGAARRYLIGPEDFRAADRAAAERRLEIVGVYHSHPDVPPVPSAYDREHAWPWFGYLIVSVRRGRATDMRAWGLADDRSGFVERPVRVAE